MLKNFLKLLQIIDSSIISIDVIAVTEAGISDSISGLFQIPGYSMYPQLRNNKKGGGIILYSKSHLKFTPFINKTFTFENVTGTLKTCSNECAALCVVYKPPRTNKTIFTVELQKHLNDSALHNNNLLILLGDTNIDLKLNTPFRNSYFDMLSALGLMCGISDYTRIEKRKDTITKSCLDHIFTRCHTLEPYTAAVDTVLADHRVTLICFDGPSVPHIQRAQKMKPVINKNILIKDLKTANWAQTNKMNEPDAIYDFIKDAFDQALKKSTHIIKFRRKKRSDLPWINNNLINLCTKRDELHGLWRKDTNNHQNRLLYIKARNKTNKAIEYSRNKYYKNLITDNYSNPKKLWKIINTICGRVSSSIDQSIIDAFGSANITTSEIANKFADEFDSSVKKILPNCNSDLLNNKFPSELESDSSMLPKKATYHKIKKLLSKLNSRKSNGLDNIKVKDIQSISDNITIALVNLINTSIQTGKYPDKLKQGCVRPIFKKGKKTNPGDYRPITLLSSIDKIVERFISDQIHSFYADNHIINESQYGFQPKKSAPSLLSKFTDDINSALNAKKNVLALFIDFSRAFDTLDHKKLLKSLSYTGIRGPLLTWCNDYLTNRSYRVKVGDDLSEPIEITQGTAQGSVLGPLHFLAYVNNMSHFSNECQLYQFADDTCLISADHNIDVALNNLQEDFNNISKWCHDAGLVLNSIKTKLINIRSPYLKSAETVPKLIAHTHACMHDNRDMCDCPHIEVVKSHTYLGLVIDNRFNWGAHVQRVCDKLRALLANFYVIKNRIPHKTKILIYKSFCESTINYGLTSYGRTFKTYLDSIFKLQVRLLKLIVPTKIKNSSKNDETKLFKYCQTLPVYTNVNFMLLKEQFFNTNIQQEINHPVQTRRVTQKKLVTTRANNSYGERTSSYLVPRLINNLPTDTRQSLTHSNIRIKLKKYFMSTLE